MSTPGPRRWDTSELAALAALAFGPGSVASPLTPGHTRHLAYLSVDTLELDLLDPQQRDFGDFELLEQIGLGGMGVVYRARQKSLERDVAIKLLSAGPWASKDFIERFRREAQSAARLQHPNIVAIHEFGSHNELNFLSMALVRGPSLAQVLTERGKLPPREASQLLRRIAEALDYAHRLGVLHLDLKPGNVLIDAGGEPLIADFGLARQLDDSMGADNDEVSGTPAYMAPEQIELKRHRLSPATDLYGLGVILYELLSGHPPFMADNPQETLKLVLAGKARGLRRDDTSIPKDLEAICLTCLATEPAARYPNARALADDLGRFLEGRAVSVRPLTMAQRIHHWSRREPLLAGVAGFATVSLVAGILATSLQWQRAEHNADRARQQLWQQRIDETAVMIQTRGPLEALPAMVDNLAEQEAAGANREAQLSRVRIGSLLAQAPALVDQIATGDMIAAIALDPAGQWVATGNATGRVRAFDLATGRLRWESDTGSTGQYLQGKVLVRLDVSPDGKWLIGTGNSTQETPTPYVVDQILLDAATGSLHMPPADRFPRLIDTSFSADGGNALIHTDNPQAPGGIQSQLLRTTDWQALGPVVPLRLAVALLAPGSTSLASNTENGSTVDLLGAADLRLQHRYRRPGPPLRSWFYSNDGRRLALGYGDGQIVLLDVESGKSTLLGPKLGAQVRELRFSEDDAWLAASDSGGGIQVWDLATGAQVCDPLRLPGKRISFMTQAAGSVPAKLSLDRGQRALFAVNNNRATLWRLPDTPGPATELLQRPDYPQLMQRQATAMLPRLGLLVVGAEDGALRLWRLRSRQPLPGASPSMAVMDSNTASDGRSAVSVAGDTITVLDVVTRRPIGPAIRYPQAVGYAQLTADGAILVSTAGPRLYAHDPRSGRPRFAARALDANPNALLLSPRGDRLLLGSNGHQGGKNLQVLESYSLATGARTGRVALWPPERMLHFSGDGASVLAWHVQVFDVLDAVTLRPHFPPAWPDEPPRTPGKGSAAHEILTEGAFVAHLWIDAMANGDDGRSAWLLSAGRQNLLQPMDAVTGRIEPGWQLPSYGENLQWLPGGRVAVSLPEVDQVKFYARDGRHHNLLVGGVSSYAGLALSGDGKRLSVALDQGVQVFDTDNGDWLSPPLRVAEVGDEIFGIAIDIHGERLLLRSRGLRAWSIGLEAERRPMPALRRLAALLHPDDTMMTRAYVPALDPQTRAALRRDDPGPPQLPASLPTATRTVVANDPIAAIPRSDRLAVDLRPWCNLDLATSQEHIFRGLRLDRVFAPGRQRLLGIDYDVRCAIMANNLGGQQDRATPMPTRVAGIVMPQAKLTTLHLLMTSGTMLREDKIAPIAVFEFAYRDGSRARLPILYRKQLWEWWTDSTEGGARLAFVAFGSIDSTPSTYPPFFFEVPLHNPHPEREVASVALEAVDRDWSQPVLLAITVEPVTNARTRAAAAAH